MPTQSVTVKKVEFSLIKPIWFHHLWPARKSEILQASPIAYLGAYQPDLLDSQVSFWAIYKQSQLAGVISGFKTDLDHYRSRGLFVFEQYRHQGLSKRLFQCCEQQAQVEGCRYLWSLPRKSAYPAYSSYGFSQTSDWISDEFEFGPNCFAKKEVFKNNVLELG